MTYIDNVLNLAQDSCDRLADEGDSVEQSRLADEDVEKGLVHAHELAEGFEDGGGVGGVGHWGTAIHLGDGRGHSRDYVGESSDDLL